MTISISIFRSFSIVFKLFSSYEKYQKQYLNFYLYFRVDFLKLFLCEIPPRLRHALPAQRIHSNLGKDQHMQGQQPPRALAEAGTMGERLCRERRRWTIAGEASTFTIQMLLIHYNTVVSVLLYTDTSKHHYFFTLLADLASYAE